MKVLWGRVTASIFALIALVIALSNYRDIRAFLASMQYVDDPYQEPDCALGMIAFSLVGVLIVALVRILTSSGSSR